MHKLYFSVFLFVCSTHLLFSQTDSSLANGLVKQKEGKHEAAVLDFSEVIKKHEPEVQVFLAQLEEYQKFSDFERAEKGLTAPPIDVAFARYYYLRAVSYVAMEKNAEAMDDLNTAVKIDPKSAPAYYERGKILWAEGKKFEGCNDLGMARTLGDSLALEMFDEKFCWSEAVHFYRDALSKLKLKQYEKALELIQRSIQLCPDSAKYVVIRAKCYSGLEKLDLAFADFDKAIAVLPNSKEAYFGRGVVFYTKSKFQEAFDDLDKAIRINDRFVDAYLYRAYACEGMSKVQSALYDYQQVQRLKPKDPLAFYKSGLLKNENGDAKGACADFRKAAALQHPEAADYVKSCK